MKNLIKEQMESKYAIIVYCHVPVRQLQCDTFLYMYFVVVESNKKLFKKSMLPISEHSQTEALEWKGFSETERKKGEKWDWKIKLKIKYQISNLNTQSK